MVFVSYARVARVERRVDEKLWEQIETRLTPRRAGSTSQIQLWNPHKDIVPGQNRRSEISAHMQAARIFLLLLSSDYFVDEECMQQMEGALKRKQEEGDRVTIIPILLRPCSWEDMGLEDFEILPSNRVPISEWSRSDSILLEVARGIQATINYIDKNESTDTGKVAPSNTPPPQTNPAPGEPVPVRPATANPVSSPQNETVDVGIMIALKEEFSVLFAEIGANYRAVHDVDTNAFYYSFERNSTVGKRPYRCVATFTGDMGAVPASMLAQNMIMSWKPSTMVLIGLAGALNDGVKLGDIVVADQVDGFMENAKVNPAANDRGYDFSLSGEVYRTSSRIWNAAQNFEFSQRDAFLAWQKGTEETQRSLLGKQRFKLLGEDMMREQAQIIKGHIASGPVVVAATPFAKWLKGRDRKYMAVEMESMGMMAAVDRQPIVRDTLILRTISDPSNEQKSLLDTIEDGVIRRYAMRNAIQLLWSFLDTGLLPQQP